MVIRSMSEMGKMALAQIAIAVYGEDLSRIMMPELGEYLNGPAPLRLPGTTRPATPSKTERETAGDVSPRRTREFDCPAHKPEGFARKNAAPLGSAPRFVPSAPFSRRRQSRESSEIRGPSSIRPAVEGSRTACHRTALTPLPETTVPVIVFPSTTPSYCVRTGTPPTSCTT
ncbi:MAG: hypothetical protein A4E67_01020 [Syntrophaceae bacterium PtaB.Bin038]|nr:MAG: hypothetical protein A4E67_01020 [Syntrophaceae bacterium PtaB.Bin038]